MTGPELRAIRARLGLTAVELGRALGLAGEDGTIGPYVSRLESGMRPIPTTMGRLAYMYGEHGVPARYLPTPPPLDPDEPMPRI